jgi:hypothetical protein
MKRKRGIIYLALFVCIIFILSFSVFCSKKNVEKLEAPPESGSMEESEVQERAYEEKAKVEDVSPGSDSGVEGGLTDTTTTDIPEITRKVIITGSVTIEVENVQEKMYKVKEVCENYNGRIDSQVLYSGEWGERVEGYTTCRVPIDDFYKFLGEVEKIGELKSKNISSEDVTLQHIDLLARLENAKRLEARYLEISEQYTGNINDMLRVEQEISRVREEIEILEGRLRSLKEQESLSTLTVELIEPESTIQPLLELGPTIKTTFNWALKIFVGFIGFIIILIPFIVIFLIFWFVIRWIIRLFRKKKKVKE